MLEHGLLCAHKMQTELFPRNDKQPDGWWTVSSHDRPQGSDWLFVRRMNRGGVVWRTTH